ncbi:MAG: pyridoxal phosphate-dependent aminotransferase [Spirochaetia bacterium]|jgi:aspartate aminotransferase|nr:pyridoxal phosphate-dependent aminotransferase [Spirochaetia bacterium]
MVSEKIRNMMDSSSFIRKMFETGAKLKQEFGSENVYDFSLGNPAMDPPEIFTKILLEKAADHHMHRYMPNAGYLDVREKVAEYISSEQETAVTANNIVMTSGAGGALNTILKTIINPGDKIIASIPCFMEYKFYCDNHGGELNLVNGKDDFNLDIEAIETAITEKTAAVIINSPNNPSGRIYPKETLDSLAAMLNKKSKETGRTIYLISDEPYRKIVYNNITVPSVMDTYKNSVVCTSYSKDLSVPGERIGWLAVNPVAEDYENLINGIILCNRILGYVNAPALMQRTIAELQGVSVDINLYKNKRDILAKKLAEFGFKFKIPDGTFYFFVEAPGGFDMKLVDLLKEERILVVPGRGFSLPGYFRIAYCVDDSVIEGSMAGFKRTAEKLGLKQE